MNVKRDLVWKIFSSPKSKFYVSKVTDPILKVTLMSHHYIAQLHPPKNFHDKFRLLALYSSGADFIKGLRLNQCFCLSQGLNSKTLVLARSGT